MGKIKVYSKFTQFPTGAIIAFMATSIPGYGPAFSGGNGNQPYPWIPLIGGTYTITTYPDLYDYLKAGGSTCIYGGTPPQFRVPNIQGYVLRMEDNGAGRDPDYTSRSDSERQGVGGGTGDRVGTVQDDEFVSHNHPGPSGHFFWVDDEGGQSEGPASGSYDMGHSGATGYRGGSETRMKNIYVVYCIKT